MCEGTQSALERPAKTRDPEKSIKLHDDFDNLAYSRDAALKGNASKKRRRSLRNCQVERPGLTRVLVPRVIHHARLSFDTAVGDVVTTVDREKCPPRDASRISHDALRKV